MKHLEVKKKTVWVTRRKNKHEQKHNLVAYVAFLVYSVRNDIQIYSVLLNVMSQLDSIVIHMSNNKTRNSSHD